MSLASAEAATAAPINALRHIEWAPVIAGAVAAASISFVLLAFGAAIGLSSTSAWPERGLSISLAFILLALWVTVVQAGSFAAGGYLAGRLRSGTGGAVVERHFRDGAHGFLVWALGVLLGAALAGGAIVGITKSLVEGGATVAAGAAARGVQPGEATQTAALDMSVDYLFRAGSEPLPANALLGPPPRAEVMRVIAAAVRDGSLSPRDRDYLVELVGQRTRMTPAEAQRRVEETFVEARAADAKLRAAADRARKLAALAGFLAAAGLAVGCVAACAGAAIGARHREEGKALRVFGRERFW